MARLEQLALSNAKAAAEAALRSGRCTLADDARQEMSRMAAQLMAVFESSLGEFALAIMADKPATQRDAMRTLRGTWRAIRERAAKAKGADAVVMPALIEDDQLAPNGGQNV